MKKLTYSGYINLPKEPVPQVCELCEIETYCCVHHVFNGNANRKISDKYGLVAFLCPRCHDTVHKDASIRYQLKVEYQRLFIKMYSREKFLELFLESWE